jgi:hypothetical protein
MEDSWCYSCDPLRNLYQVPTNFSQNYHKRRSLSLAWRILGDMYEKEKVIFIQTIFNKMKMVPPLLYLWTNEFIASPLGPIHWNQWIHCIAHKWCHLGIRKGIPKELPHILYWKQYIITKIIMHDELEGDGEELWIWLYKYQESSQGRVLEVKKRKNAKIK